MTDLYLLIPTLFAIFFCVLVVKAAAVALRLTGMEEERARFQALSAFTGTGFTTRETEEVMINRLRRRIVEWLMLLGYVGIVTVMITATSSFVRSEGYRIPLNALILIGGVYLLYKMASHRRFAARWETFVARRILALAAFRDRALDELLHLENGYGVVSAPVLRGSPLEGRELGGCGFGDGGVAILGIERGDQWIPLPGAAERIAPGDRLVAFGKLDATRKLFRRPRS